MGTLNRLRNNSSKVIWAFLIVFILSMVAGGILSGGFSIVPQIKAVLGVDTPERNSVNLDGNLITHSDYINVFSGFHSPNSLVSTSPLFIYHRHHETIDELKGIKAINDIYKDFFKSDLSELDKLFFIAKNLDNQNLNNSSIFPLAYPYTNFGPNAPKVHSINKIKGSISRTHFDSFSESFKDTLNNKYDRGEEFDDLNGNGFYDEGEEFTDALNGAWDNDENFTDIGNGIWDEGEEFIDTNENNAWDEGEEFTDKGNGVWDNGQDKWLTNSFKLGHIDYESINDENQSNSIDVYINNVASYDAKYEKLESIFNTLSFNSKFENTQKTILDSSTATIHYIEYDLNNISDAVIKDEINPTNIASKIKPFKKIHSGISTYTLIIICLLLILFIYKNKEHKGKFAFGSIFLSLLFLVVCFKIIDQGNQGSEKFKEISYIYLTKLNGELYTDSKNGKYDAGVDQDCGLDGLCKADKGYTAPDEDGTENNNFLDSESFTDLNDNGVWDEGEEFVDANGNGAYDLEEKYADFPNGLWDEGEEFVDANENGIWDNGDILTDIKLNELKESITVNGFDIAYNDYNGLKSNKIIVSKIFNSESDLLSQNTISAMIFDIIDNSFNTEKNGTFVIENKDNNDNLNGYLIGYIEDEGNYYQKVQINNLTEITKTEAKKNYITQQNLFSQTISEILGEETLDLANVFSNKDKLDQLVNMVDEGFKIETNYNLNNFNGINGNNSGTISGTLMQMDEGEVSDVIFSNNKAYLIFMLNKQKSNIKSKETNPDLDYTFSDYFNETKKSQDMNDWRDEASRSIPDESGYTSNINDIYFNFGNFKSAFGFR